MAASGDSLNSWHKAVCPPNKGHSRQGRALRKIPTGLYVLGRTDTVAFFCPDPRRGSDAMIRLALVEDDPRFRESVTLAVAQTADVTLSAVAMTRREALALLKGPA